jgi:calcium permeable stress-gated cation channel
LVLGFASIGLFLLYLAYRYNLLFVFNATIDTKGLVYPRALQQTTTGAYLGMIVLIGLFGVNKAAGPVILMVVFLILVIAFHVTLNSAIGPLLAYLPKSLQAEEESLLALEEGPHNGMTGGAQATSTVDDLSGAGKEMLPAPHQKPNAIVKWLKPHIYTDYQTLRRLVPRSFAEIAYDPEIERDAYYHPAIASPTPLLWIPRDNMGISRQECQHSSKVIPMTDEGASLDEKNNIVWDQESGRPPVYKEKVYY